MSKEKFEAELEDIKMKETSFGKAKSSYKNKCYKVWKDSYLNTNKNKVVSTLNGMVSDYFENINTYYEDLVEYLRDYYDRLKALEKAMSDGTLSSDQEEEVKAAINQLNAIANGYDPADIVINPKTGEVDMGATAFNSSRDISALGVKDDYRIYEDATGRFKETENLTLEEYQKYENLSRIYGCDSEKVNKGLGYNTARKLGGLNTASISNAPAVYGVLDALSIGGSVSTTRAGGIYDQSDVDTIEAAKSSAGYQIGYAGASMASFFFLGATGATGAVSSKILSKGITKGSKFVASRASETMVNAPFNMLDSIKQSTDARGNIKWSEVGKNMAINTGADFVLGGATDRGGAGKLASAGKGDVVSNSVTSPKTKGFGRGQNGSKGGASADVPKETSSLGKPKEAGNTSTSKKSGADSKTKTSDKPKETSSLGKPKEKSSSSTSKKSGADSKTKTNDKSKETSSLGKPKETSKSSSKETSKPTSKETSKPTSEETSKPTSKETSESTTPKERRATAMSEETNERATSNEQKTMTEETSERTTSNEQKTAPKETSERTTSNE
ncbi:MAG: hypothetical protein ACI31R_02960, partial [Bacilli bacterium]